MITAGLRSGADPAVEKVQKLLMRRQSQLARVRRHLKIRARLEVPAASAAPAMAALADDFGPCVAGHPVPMETTQLTAVCVLANDDAVTREGEPPSRLYVIGTGIRTDDGTRVIDMTIRSR